LLGLFEAVGPAAEVWGETGPVGGRAEGAVRVDVAARLRATWGAPG